MQTITLESLLIGEMGDNTPILEPYEAAMECADAFQECAEIEQNLTTYEAAKLIKLARGATMESAEIVAFEEEKVGLLKKLKDGVIDLWHRIVNFFRSIVTKLKGIFKKKNEDMKKLAKGLDELVKKYPNVTASVCAMLELQGFDSVVSQSGNMPDMTKALETITLDDLTDESIEQLEEMVNMMDDSIAMKEVSVANLKGVSEKVFVELTSNAFISRMYDGVYAAEDFVKQVEDKLTKDNESNDEGVAKKIKDLAIIYQIMISKIPTMSEAIQESAFNVVHALREADKGSGTK